MKVKVEKIAGHKKAFVNDGTWYNFLRDGDGAKMPATIREGGYITLTEYEEEPNGNIKFTEFQADKGGVSKDGGKDSGARKGPEVQQLIVRQNALTNAVAFGVANEATVDQVIALMNKFASAVMDLEAAKPAAKAAVRKKAQPVVEEVEDEDPLDDLDDED